MSDSEEEEPQALENGSDEEYESDDGEEEEEEEGQRRQGMHWLNEPEEWSQHRTTVMMRVPPGTDFWRKTNTDTVVDNAPFYFLEVEGDFEVRVKVKANYESPDDQAGIMVMEDEENWIKLGIQMVGDVPHMCSTVTHDWSDWAMHPLPHLPEYMWVHAKKIGDGLEVYISEDSFDWMQIRQGDIVDDAILKVGVYCASPNSEDGFEVTFEDFMIKDEQR
jgi:regulation of enolase protein 1 (concanavalin A-like superfamily)